MAKYGVKEIPNVIVKFRKDGDKNYKTLVLDGLTEYSFNLQDNYCSLVLTSALGDDMFFNTFKPALLKNELHDFKISATNYRRSAETGLDEEYDELKSMPFTRCHLTYTLNAEGTPSRFKLLFMNVGGKEND